MKLTAVTVNGYGSFEGLAGREKQSQFPAARVVRGPRDGGRGVLYKQTQFAGHRPADMRRCVVRTLQTSRGLPRQTKPISRRGRANLAPPASGLPSAGCTNKAKFTGRPVPRRAKCAERSQSGGPIVQNEPNLPHRQARVRRAGAAGAFGRANCAKRTQFPGARYPTIPKARGFEAATPKDHTDLTRLGRTVRLVIVAAPGYHGGVPRGIA